MNVRDALFGSYLHVNYEYSQSGVFFHLSVFIGFPRATPTGYVKKLGSTFFVLSFSFNILLKRISEPLIQGEQ